MVLSNTRRAACIVLLAVLCDPFFTAAQHSREEAESLIAGTVEKGLRALYAEQAELSIGASTIAAGPFTWEETGIGTEFSDILLRAARRGVLASSVFQLTIDDPVPFFGGETELPGTVPAEAASAFRLFGTYRIEQSEVVIQLKIFSTVFSRLMAEKTISVALSDLPAEIELYPPNRAVLEKVEDELGGIFGSGQLDIHVTTDRGAGGVYHEGEELVLSLLSNRDCYIRILHIDVHGNMTQVFPNRYESNNFLPGRQLLTFPSRRSPFRFRIVPPYGTETIKVIASTQQFSDPGADFRDLGFATRGLALEGVGEAETEIMADAMVYFTILREAGNGPGPDRR